MHKYEIISTGGGFSVKNGSTVTKVIEQDGTLVGGVAIDNNAITTAKIADGAVTYAKRSSVSTGAATADGTGTGTIPAGTTFFTATSDGATKQVKLPAATAALIGQTVDVYIGETGCEVITATSAHTINGADADGTNQYDLAANTLTRFIQVTATGWIAYQVAYTTITSFAADND